MLANHQREPSGDQPDHQRVVVRAGDEVHDHEWVEDAKPQRARRIDAVSRRQDRDSPGQNDNSNDREHSEHQRHREGARAGDVGEQPAEQEEDLPVRARGISP